MLARTTIGRRPVLANGHTRQKLIDESPCRTVRFAITILVFGVELGVVVGVDARLPGVQ